MFCTVLWKTIAYVKSWQHQNMGLSSKYLPLSNFFGYTEIKKACMKHTQDLSD